jgi:hypothetical protein
MVKKLFSLALIFALVASCRKEDAASSDPGPPPRPNRPEMVREVDSAAEEGKLVRRSDLDASRPAHQKRKAPTAELAPGQLGKVVSPFTGEMIDVKGAVAGTLFFDPKHPDDEGMAFYLPEGIQGAPQARAVPGKAGFVFSPYNNKIIDVRGIPPGTLIADPTYPADEKKYFRLKDVPIATEVPGKPGFFFSPYDNQVVDARGVEPGTIIEDPNSISVDSAAVGPAKQFRIPRIEE